MAWLFVTELRKVRTLNRNFLRRNKHLGNLRSTKLSDKNTNVRVPRSESTSGAAKNRPYTQGFGLIC